MLTTTLPTTMRTAIVSSGPIVTLTTTTLPPTPLAHQVLVRTIFASSNPKDWKRPTLMSHAPLNQGDDASGIVVSIGPDVTDFAVGDRVAALHQPGTEWGTYAEYCLVWDYAAFIVPDGFDLAAASTFGMPALTAAVGLYRILELPLPGARGPGSSSSAPAQKRPVIVYGASSAVGAFAVKLARLGGLHPIIAVAGAGGTYVRTLLDESKGDTLVDYRAGEEETAKTITAALKRQGVAASLALDAVPDANSQSLLGRVLGASDSASVKHIASVLPPPKVEGFPEDVKRTFVMSPIIFQDNDAEGGDRDANHAFGKQVMEMLGDAVREGRLSGHPYEAVPGGFEGIEAGLKSLQAGKNSAKKYVYEVGKQ